jgi:acyl carrier protein
MEEGDWAAVLRATVEVRDAARVERIAAFFSERGFQVSVDEDGDDAGLRRVSALRPAAPGPDAWAPEVASGVSAEGWNEADAAPDAPGEVLAGVAAIWLELLGTAPSPGDDFFLLGGHSLLATQLLSRVRDAFGVELSLVAVFRARTLTAFASLVEEALGMDDAAALTEEEALGLL